jgi:NAD(P)-dependent dehydrogenase (short-subunit alcohol dehydrogenase family)
MREFAGKTAFVTGGAAGIGLALGRVFAQSGMKVMLADTETDALQAAVKSLQEISPGISGTICDVADAESVERAAQAAFDAFGNVHVVCNIAGVAAGGGIDQQRRWWPRLPEISTRDLSPTRSPRACSPPSGKPNSTFLRTPACGPR